MLEQINLTHLLFALAINFRYKLAKMIGIHIHLKANIGLVSLQAINQEDLSAYTLRNSSCLYGNMQSINQKRNKEY
jgi:hypothetical protein